MVKLLVGVLALAAVSFGDFTYNVDNLADLSHSKVFAVGMNYTLQTNEIITGASLTLTNVYNVETWNGSPNNNVNNALFIDLIDNANSGLNEVASENDNNNSLVDYFTANNYTVDQLDRLNWNIGAGNQGLYSTRNQTTGNIDAAPVLIPSVYNSATPSILPTNTVTINFTQSELNSLAGYLRNNGNFGIGLDPDCHYEVTKFRFDMKTTTNVPEPTMLSLLGASLLGLAFFRRKK